MLGARTLAAAAGQTDDHRHLDLATGQVTQHGALVGQLVDRDGNEIAKLEFKDRPHAGYGRADRHANHGGLGTGHVADALGAELFGQAGGDAERRGQIDVLAHLKDIAVAAHFLAHGFVDGAAKRGQGAFLRRGAGAGAE